MNATTKPQIVNPDKPPPGIEFTIELAMRRTLESRQLTRAGEYGFRLVCLADETNNKRWIDAAVRFADDDALAQGVRGERLGTGEQADYASSAGGYTQTQLDAITRLRSAKTAVGPVHAQIVYDVAVTGLTAAALGKVWKISDKTASNWGCAALEALALYYETPR